MIYKRIFSSVILPLFLALSSSAIAGDPIVMDGEDGYCFMKKIYNKYFLQLGKKAGGDYEFFDNVYKELIRNPRGLRVTREVTGKNEFDRRFFRIFAEGKNSEIKIYLIDGYPTGTEMEPSIDNMNIGADYDDPDNPGGKTRTFIRTGTDEIFRNAVSGTIDLNSMAKDIGGIR